VALRNLITSLPNLNPNPNPMLSDQVESESEKNGSDLHHDFIQVHQVSREVVLELWRLNWSHKETQAGIVVANPE
jgi:hypothetical protein